MNDQTQAVRGQLLELHGAAERLEMLVGGGLPTLAGAERLVGLARLNEDLERLADQADAVAGPASPCLVWPTPTGPRPA